MGGENYESKLKGLQRATPALPDCETHLWAGKLYRHPDSWLRGALLDVWPWLSQIRFNSLQEN